MLHLLTISITAAIYINYLKKERSRRMNKLIANIIVFIILIIAGSIFFGFKNTWKIISNTNLLPFIISGVFMVALGINIKKYGRLIYYIVFLLITLICFLLLK